MSELNIYQRIDKIREEVSYIQKDASVQGYKAVTHDQVTSELRPAMIKHGVVTVMRQTCGAIEDTGKVTKAGTPFTRYVASYDIDFVNIANPTDKFTTSISSIAEDQGDKGPGKCASYAMKTILLKTFNIETGESDESRQEQKPVPINDDHYTILHDKCKEWGFPVTKTLKALAKKVYRLKDIKDLPVDKFDDAVERIEKKGRDEAGK